MAISVAVEGVATDTRGALEIRERGRLGLECLFSSFLAISTTSRNGYDNSCCRPSLCRILKNGKSATEIFRFDDQYIREPPRPSQSVKLPPSNSTIIASTSGIPLRT